MRVTVQPLPRTGGSNAITYLRGEGDRRGSTEAGAPRHVDDRPGRETRTQQHTPFGGTRMGDDPETNVVEQVGVLARGSRTSALLGASTFPTSGGHNPTQQVQAMALRTARHLRRNWKSIAQ